MALTQIPADLVSHVILSFDDTDDIVRRRKLDGTTFQRYLDFLQSLKKQLAGPLTQPDGTPISEDDLDNVELPTNVWKSLIEKALSIQDIELFTDLLDLYSGEPFEYLLNEDGDIPRNLAFDALFAVLNHDLDKDVPKQGKERFDPDDWVKLILANPALVSGIFLDYTEAVDDLHRRHLDYDGMTEQDYSRINFSLYVMDIVCLLMQHPDTFDKILLPMLRRRPHDLLPIFDSISARAADYLLGLLRGHKYTFLESNHDFILHTLTKYAHQEGSTQHDAKEWAQVIEQLRNYPYVRRRTKPKVVKLRITHPVPPVVPTIIGMPNILNIPNLASLIITPGTPQQR